MIKTKINMKIKEHPEFVDENYIEQIALSDFFIETDSYIDRSQFEISVYDYHPENGGIYIGISHEHFGYSSNIDLVYYHELSELCILIGENYHPITTSDLWVCFYFEKEKD